MGKFIIKETKTGIKFDLKAANGEVIATSEVYASEASGEFRFRLKATNGQIIAVSEGYKTMRSCKNGIASVQKNAVDSAIEKI